MSRISKIEQRIENIREDLRRFHVEFQNEIRHNHYILERARECRPNVHNLDQRMQEAERALQCVKNGCHDFGDRHKIFEPSYHGDKPLPVNRQTCQRCGFVKDTPISKEVFKKLTK